MPSTIIQGQGPATPLVMSYNPRKVHSLDVICHLSDPRCRNHKGNTRFSIMMCMFLIKDYNMKDVSVRVWASTKIIAAIKTGNPYGGRFLAPIHHKRSWKEIDNTLAIKWISLVLKRAALALDNKANPKDPKSVADCVKLVMCTGPQDSNFDEKAHDCIMDPHVWL